MRAFVAGTGIVEVLGSKVNGERGQHRWNHHTFTLPLYLCGQRVFFRPFTLEANHIAALLGCYGFPGCLSHDDSMKWPNPEALPLTSLYIPSQDNEEPHPSISLVS